MMGKEIDPSDIGKHPKIIRVAQADMAQTDVLVCGKCHNVFHFIELFQDHKDMGCEKDSEIKDSRESKPKVWAFLLWKAAQLSLNEHLANTTNSWKLYQQWVKMEESIRETWIVAGKTIQSFARMGQGSLQEMPVKITKTVVDNSPKAVVSTPKPGPRVVDNKQIFRKEIQTDNEEELSPIRVEQNRVVRKPVTQLNQVKTPPANNTLNKTISRRANRTVPDTNGQEIEEEVVEKIIAKRFNPRRKMNEYLVKWERYPHEQNTWEPQTHLESCPQLLDTFEKQLARQKEQRAAQAAKQAAQAAIAPAAAPATVHHQSPLPTLKNSPQSPLRQGQVARNLKSRVTEPKWASQEDNSVKRKLDDSEDFDESGATEEDLDENGAPPSKRLKNGNAILRMDSSGEVKISQVSSTTSKTVNGSLKSSSSDASAEVVITKDPQSSGIVKKAGLSPMSTSKSEAHIKILGKGDNSSSGVVRLNKLPPGGITTGQTRITQISNRDAGTPARVISNSATPPRANVGQTRMVQRATHSPNTIQPATKATINRVTKPQPEKSNAITPEQKIIQLSQKNDLKVTRKVIHSAHPQTAQVAHAAINKIPVANDLAEEPFPEPQSPPRPMTLCPVTGKVLAQAEGEPSPVPSPEHTKKENDLAHLQNQANVTSVGILQTNSIQPAEQHQEHVEGIPEGLTLTTETEDGQTQHILTSEDGTPILVTGEDGTIYQVAGKNAEGQTILIAQGADGEQQYAYVAAEEGDEGGVLTLDNAVAEAVAQMLPEQQAEALAAAAAAASGGETQFILKQEDESDGTAHTEALTIQTGDGSDSQDGNIPAEVVQADLPSPGGTRRVVLLLQDGTFMMTEMHDDEYQALNIVAS